LETRKKLSRVVLCTYEGQEIDEKHQVFDKHEASARPECVLVEGECCDAREEWHDENLIFDKGRFTKFILIIR
jgi:hypothetical protein